MTSQINPVNHVSDTPTESSDEIRENIEHKRRSMGSKLDQIQERLDPRYLRDQTQEVVRNVVADGTDAMMDYVRENTRELGQSLTGALKRHPLPAALIGLGLVWLMVDSVSGSSESSYDRSRRSNFDPYRPNRRFYDYERAANDPSYRAEYGAEYGGRYDRGYGSGSYSDQYGRYYGQNYAQGNAQSRGDEPSLKEKAVDAVSDAAENVRETVKEWGQEVGEKASEIGGEIRERVGDFRHDAQWQAEQFRHQAAHRARQVSSENPLMTGAIAFAIGAAAGLLLPPTRKENEWMGEARERFVNSTRQAADEVVHRAEEIVQEVKPDVEQAVKEIGDSVKRTGQEAADRLKETAQNTRAKVEQEVKTEMGKIEEKVESKVGGKPVDGSTTDKPAVNNPNRTSSAT